MRRIGAAAIVLFTALPLFAQDTAAQTASGWIFKSRIELRANYRDSREEKFALKFPFSSNSLPVGQTVGFEETVNAGSHAELSVAQIKLDLGYGNWFLAHTQLHGQDKYRRNPTSADRKVDADELWIQIGPRPEFLSRPERTSFFVQLGKFVKMERQPIRLLESYGLAATSFNRFEDVGVMTGGSIGRNVYWRLTGTSGNPLYIRDPNALAGDNGISELLQPHPNPRLKSGFPILYDTRIEDLALDTKNMSFGQGLGYRWQNDAQTFGFDAVAFHYRRTLLDGESAPLTGTFYGVDLDLLEGPQDRGLPIRGNKKEETGARVYTEWKGLTSTIQFTSQTVAGMHRSGAEAELGYKFDWAVGPSIGGESFLQSIQPAVRWSELHYGFKGNGAQYPAPSIWWNWTKIDAGIRIGFAKNVDLTIERTKNNVGAPKKIHPDETLATLRIRI
ncbi:MAG: hypothetical protein QOK37_511 [Thermoanaerobaculia bacterium]|jgi:hypothetical protein|nr:hypothetical protein [Thermoanaerobaculia bacterium]